MPPKGKKSKAKGTGSRKKVGVTPTGPQQGQGRRSQATCWDRLRGGIFSRGEVMEFPEGSPAAEVVDALHLTQADIRRMKKKFQDVDVDGSGEIDYNEFFEMIDETRSAYADALFHLIDVDGSGTISFEEMIQVLSTYCMYSKEDILNFCFDTFDKDGSGTIDEEEFMNLCKAVNNANPMFPGNFMRALSEFDRNDDGLIDHDEFRELNKRYPLVLFPAFRLQDSMQKATLGEERWADVHRIMFKKRQVEEYRQTHSGEFPPLTCWESIVMRFTKVHPYEKLFKADVLKEAQKEAAAMEEPSRNASSLSRSLKVSRGSKKVRKSSVVAAGDASTTGKKKSSRRASTAGTPKGDRRASTSGEKKKSRRSSTAGTPKSKSKKVAPG